MADSVKRLYKSGYSLAEIANILGKSEYYITKLVNQKQYNKTFLNEHRAFNQYKNGVKVKNVIKVLGKSKSTFYKELKKSGHKKDLQSDHNNDFVKRTKDFLKSAKNKNYNTYIAGEADYSDDLVQSWKKSGKKIPKYYFKGIRGQSDLRDLKIDGSISKIHYFKPNGDLLSKSKFKTLYGYEITKSGSKKI